LKKVYWRPQGIPKRAMLLIALLSLASFVAVEKFPRIVKQPWHTEKLAAARLTAEAFKAIKAERIARGIPIEPEADPLQTGLIGHSITPVTSNSGYISAKRASVNPNWAALVVHWLKRAGVEKGDVVAVGVSGSFPALCIATLAAVQTLDLTPVVIASASASEWGANDPNYMWLDMEKVLYEKKIFGFRSVASSRGGIDDKAFGISEEGRKLIDAAITRNGVERIDSDSLVQGVEERMRIYDAQAANRQIKAYINVGGGTASVGTHVGKKQFAPGLNLEPPSGEGIVDSVMLRFARRRVAVIHLSGIEALAKTWGFREEPSSVPNPGEGRVYVKEEYNRWIAGVSLAILLAAMLGFLRLDFATRLLRNPIRRTGRANQPQQMV
jgi:poly-gamma-glutamate system protein